MSAFLADIKQVTIEDVKLFDYINKKQSVLTASAKKRYLMLIITIYMLAKELIVETARKYLNTPYHHQARSQAGLDCVGLPLMVCWDLGLLPRSLDFNNYARTPDHSELMALLNQYCTPTDTPEIGDLLVFKIYRNPRHLAIKTDVGMIHAYDSPGKVVEHPVDPWWENRIVAAFELPQVAN